jgi:hypothetical protein
MSHMHHSFGHHGHSHPSRTPVLRIAVDFNPGYSLVVKHVSQQNVIDNAILNIRDKLSPDMERYSEYTLESKDLLRAKEFIDKNGPELKRLFELKILKRLTIGEGKMTVFYRDYATPEKQAVIEILELLTIMAKRG